MINFKIIYKIIGTLLFIEAAMMMWCLGLSIYLHEKDMLAFLISIAVTVLGGVGFRRLGRGDDRTLDRREAYLLVTLTWIIFSLFGSLPFMLSGTITNFTDAYFETISGFTTTGCSIIDDVEVLPHATLFWRTMTQWIGGLGIVFFTIAIIPSLVGGNVKVFSAEATGPIRAKMHPRLGTTAKWIWSIYFLLTIGCAACYYLAGMGLFDCLNYAMTTTATGGFSTHNASTGYFHNPYLFAVLGAALLITIVLCHENGYHPIDAIRVSLFQVTSMITTTGIFNDDAAKWHHITWVILSFCMFLGGCSGSTSGGFKSIRMVMLLNILRNEIKRILHPRAVLPVKVNDNTISYSYQVSLLAFFTAYTLLCLTESGHRALHVVGRAARHREVAALAAHAHGPSGNLHRGGALYHLVLERELTGMLPRYKLYTNQKKCNLLHLNRCSYPPSGAATKSFLSNSCTPTRNRWARAGKSPAWRAVRPLWPKAPTKAGI